MRWDLPFQSSYLWRSHLKKRGTMVAKWGWGVLLGYQCLQFCQWNILPKSGHRFQFCSIHCHHGRRDALTDLFWLLSTPQRFRNVSLQAIVAYRRRADALSPRFLSSGRCGYGHSCPTGLCVRAHEEVQFQLVSRRNTLTMTSRLSVVYVSSTEADNSYARRELSDRSFDTHVF